MLITPAHAPPNPTAILELKRRSSTLFHLWLISDEDLDVFVNKHGIRLAAPCEFPPLSGTRPAAYAPASAAPQLSRAPSGQTQQTHLSHVAAEFPPLPGTRPAACTTLRLSMTPSGQAQLSQQAPLEPGAAASYMSGELQEALPGRRDWCDADLATRHERSVYDEGGPVIESQFDLLRRQLQFVSSPAVQPSSCHTPSTAAEQDGDVLSGPPRATQTRDLPHPDRPAPLATPDLLSSADGGERVWPISWGNRRAAEAEVVGRAPAASPHSDAIPPRSAGATGASASLSASRTVPRAAASVGKRLPTAGKKRQAESALEQQAWGAALNLQPATAAQLEWVLQAQQLAFTFHFADGSSSVRPSAAANRCDPHSGDTRVIGCSFFAAAPARGAPARWVHWDLRLPSAEDAGGEVAARVEASLQAVHRVLGSRGRQLVVPHCQVVLRALELQRAVKTAVGRREVGAEVTVGSGGRTEAEGVHSGGLCWLDPRLLGWLCDPDASEQELMLGSLYAAHLTPAADRDPDPDPVCDELRQCWELVALLFPRLLQAHGASALELLLRREVCSARLAARMEICGIGVSPPLLTEHLKAIERRQAQLSEKAERLMGHPLNLASAQQVSEALYLHLQLPRPAGSEAASKAGHGSTSETHLLALEASHPNVPLARFVLEHRELHKLRTTFLEPLAAKALPGSGGRARLYAEWHMLATGTGRLSSRHPNMQQVPKGSTTLQTESGTAEVCVRGAFVAPEGMVMLSADYTQLEMRLLAHFSSDVKLRGVLQAGGDLFCEIMSSWQGKPVAQVSAAERNQAKQLCYGLCYGLGMERLAASLGVSSSQAHSLRGRFLKSFPRLGQFQEWLRQQARQYGHVATIGGRKRLLPHIVSTNSSERAKAERQAVNSVIQVSPVSSLRPKPSCPRAVPPCAPHLAPPPQAARPTLIPCSERRPAPAHLHPPTHTCVHTHGRAPRQTSSRRPCCAAPPSLRRGASRRGSAPSYTTRWCGRWK